MRFIIFVIDGESHTATDNEMAAIDKFNTGLQEAGHWVMAAGIGSPGTAQLIDNRETSDLPTNGNSLQGDLFYSGFWIVECESQEIASEIAKSGSKACNRKVELRPFL